jgi:hypothetical protein
MVELETFENYLPALWQQEGLVFVPTRRRASTSRRRSPARTLVASAMMAVTVASMSALLDFRLPSSIRVSGPALFRESTVTRLTDAVPDGYWESLGRALKEARHLPELVADRTETII